MKPPENNTSKGAVADPSEAAWEGNPLEQFAEAHFLQREDCAALDRLATMTQPDSALATKVLHHLDTCWAHHIRDQEEDLFALLRLRSAPGDDIFDTLNRLTDDHRRSESQTKKVRQILQCIASAGSFPKRGGAAILAGFSAHKRRRVIVENAIVLPLARLRLTEDDLTSLQLRMIERRDGSGRSEEP